MIPTKYMFELVEVLSPVCEIYINQNESRIELGHQTSRFNIVFESGIKLEVSMRVDGQRSPVHDAFYDELGDVIDYIKGYIGYDELIRVRKRELLNELASRVEEIELAQLWKFFVEVSY